MAIWTPLVATTITATVAFYIFVLAGRRERDKSKREAIAKFRSAFAKEYTQIDNREAYSLMSKAKVKHDIAIHEFRPLVDSKQLQSFDAAVKKFDQCRSEVTPAPLTFLVSQASGKPVDDSCRVRLKEALIELLAFADKA